VLLLAEVELVEELWDAVVQPQPNQTPSVSLAQLECQRGGALEHLGTADVQSAVRQARQNGGALEHVGTADASSAVRQARQGGRVLAEDLRDPVLLMRGVRKEFQLPKVVQALLLCFPLHFCCS